VIPSITPPWSAGLECNTLRGMSTAPTSQIRFVQWTGWLVL
jgi:hypothetical protein